MARRRERAEIANETLEIIEKGFYKKIKGAKIEIQKLLDFSRFNSIHYKPSDFSSIFLKRNKIFKSKKRNSKTEFEVVNETTLNAASRLVNEEGLDNVLCLNFGSAKNPGGGQHGSR